MHPAAHTSTQHPVSILVSTSKHTSSPFNPSGSDPFPPRLDIRRVTSSTPSHASPTMNFVNLPIWSTAASAATRKTSSAAHAPQTSATISILLFERAVMGASHSEASATSCATGMTIANTQRDACTPMCESSPPGMFKARDTSEYSRTAPPRPSTYPAKPLKSNRMDAANKPATRSAAATAKLPAILLRRARRSWSFAPIRRQRATFSSSSSSPPSSLGSASARSSRTACLCQPAATCPRNSESTVADRNTWKPYLGSTFTSSCAKRPIPVSSPTPWKGTLEGGVTTWNLNATWNSVMTNVSISDHLPKASTTLSKFPRALQDRTPIGEYHASNMSASLRYGQPPENTAMRMASGYTPASHMSRTLLLRVNSNSGGKVRGSMPGPPSGLTTDAESMTAAPTAVLEDMNSAIFPAMARGSASLIHAGILG
mmetsp:Transcript_12530/g.57999  ORF Transcript_12530/g.57999 Transcript_12530/m.57999 type:complete len:429 (+) Transcript_12530:144-1430(+)